MSDVSSCSRVGSWSLSQTEFRSLEAPNERSPSAAYASPFSEASSVNACCVTQRADKSNKSKPSNSTSPEARKNSPIASAACPGSSTLEDSPGAEVTLPSSFICWRLLPSKERARSKHCSEKLCI